MHGTCIKTVERYILQQPGCDEDTHEKPAYVVGLWADIRTREFPEYEAIRRSVEQRSISYCAQCYDDDETEDKMGAECSRHG